MQLIPTSGWAHQPVPDSFTANPAHEEGLRLSSAERCPNGPGGLRLVRPDRGFLVARPAWEVGEARRLRRQSASTSGGKASQVASSQLMIWKRLACCPAASAVRLARCLLIKCEVDSNQFTTSRGCEAEARLMPARMQSEPYPGCPWAVRLAGGPTGSSGSSVADSQQSE